MNVRSFLSCAALSLLAEAAMGTSYYYVSPTGTDLNNGLTSAHPFASIGHAMGVAPAGSTLILAPGTYSGSLNEDLTVSRNVSLVAQGTSANTVLDLGGSLGAFHRAFIVPSGITFNVTGLTIQGGLTATPGGDISSTGGTLNFKGCVFKNGSAYHSKGGALYCNGGSATLSNCTFDYLACYDGGGIAAVGGATLNCTQCTFRHTNISNGGGGISITGGSASLTGCAFLQGLASYGIAIDAYGATVTLRQCDVSHNLDGFPTSSLVRSDAAGTLDIYNSTFSGNFGGVVADLDGGGEIVGCRFIGNQCSTANMIHFGSGATGVFANCLLTGNQADNLIANDGDLAATFLTVAENFCNSSALANNNFANVGSSIFWNNRTDFSTASGATTNITKTIAYQATYLDPLFVASAQGDFHLSPNSPGIGVGDPSATQTYSSDLEGRYRHAIPALGCFESLTVDPIATAVGADGFKRVLWFDTNGQIALWKLSAVGAVLQISKFTAPTGFAPTGLAIGTDNRAYIFLRSSAGNAVNVLTVATNGTLAGTKTYTPAAGWDFKSADVSSDNAVHLIWRNTFGTVLYWDVTAGGTTTTHTYGPLLG